MCLCTPEIKTPWCGKPGCEKPAISGENWEFDRTLWEYPLGTSSTAMPIEYAYWINRKTFEVKKVKVTTE